MPNLSPSLERESGYVGGSTTTSGFPYDLSEPTPDLQWPQSIRLYDKMRRTDAQVIGAYRGVTLPILQAEWRLDPNGARDAIVQQISEDIDVPVLGQDRPPSRLRMRDRFSFAEHLRMSLLQLVYGHMPFEQLYRIVGNQARLHKLSPRMPTTLSQIRVARDGGLEGVNQYADGAMGARGDIRVDVDRLVFYCNEREGAVWTGQSILRACYKDWLLKDKATRVNLMTLERNGMGVPTVESAQGSTPAQIKENQELASNLRSGDLSGVGLPAGSRLRLVGVEGTLPDALPTIRYHDEQIARPMLQMFINLGSTQTGSRALGSSFIDFFTLALRAVAANFADTFTAHVIEDLVDLNYGESEPAPKLVHPTIDAETEILPDALKSLIDAGAITADDDLEVALRDQYGLPQRGTGPGRVPSAPAGIGASRGRGSPFVTAAGRRLPGKADRAKVTDHYAAELRAAISESIDVEAAAKTFMGQVAAAAIRADDAAVARARKVLEAQGIDPTNTEALLVAAYGDAYVVGTHTSLAQLPGTVEAVPVAWEASIDWSAWEPGSVALRAAAELAGVDGGRGLRQLLDDAAVTIQGIDDTTLDLLARSLANGVANGDSFSAIAGSLSDIVDDPDRASAIVRTETARASSIASMDTYNENGIAGVEWLVDDPCPICEENEAASPIPLGDEFPSGDTEPPAHPSCVCAVSPVPADELG